MARYYRFPFATNGDREDVTDETPNSIVSYAEGYTQDYQRNPATDTLARRPERTLFNDLLFEITDTLRELYEHGVPPFITSADNGGSAFSYDSGSKVLFNDRIYESVIDNNTTDPTNTTNWAPIDLPGLDARYFTRTAADNRFLRQSENLNDLDNAGTARTNLELGTAATANTGTGSGDTPTTEQADLRYAALSGIDLNLVNNNGYITLPSWAGNFSIEYGQTSSITGMGISVVNVAFSQSNFTPLRIIAFASVTATRANLNDENSETRNALQIINVSTPDTSGSFTASINIENLPLLGRRIYWAAIGTAS